MTQVQLKYLFQDKPCPADAEFSDYDALDVTVEESHIYGEIMWPDGGETVRHPCVILFHGFPGSARNDDLAHALCRIGCVVLTPHHRGAWGSQGEYLVSNCVEDARVLAEYVHSERFCTKYHVDPGAVFLIGHSMGSNTVINAARKLPWLRGILLMTPFDPTRYIRNGKADTLHRLLQQGACLHSRGTEEIFQDIVAHKDVFCHEKAFDDLKDQNLFCGAGAWDECAPAEIMFQPLWQKLQGHETHAVQRFVEYQAGHGLLGVRIALIKDITQFIFDVLSK